MVTMGKKGSDRCRDVPIMGNVGMYYDNCFFLSGAGDSFILKMLIVPLNKQSISIKQNPKRGRD